MLFIVKNTTFSALLDLLIPHSCRCCGQIGEPLCSCCKNNIIKGHPSHDAIQKTIKNSNIKSLRDTKIYTIGTRTGLLNSLIHDYKYHSIRALARTFAELLDAILPPNLPENAIIVPLPTATNHIRARGLDHTYLIAKHLAKIRHLKVKKLLIRAKNTVQVGADKASRLAQAKKAFTVDKNLPIDKSAPYLLFDDVWTTGASILSAKKKLQDAGASDISIMLLAISELA